MSIQELMNLIRLDLLQANRLCLADLTGENLRQQKVLPSVLKKRLRREASILKVRVSLSKASETREAIWQNLCMMRGKVVGISDAYGGLYDPEGLDIDYLLDRRDSFGTVTKLFNDTITNQELLELDCDILVPAAIENQITEENAHNIRAKIVVEAANGPTTLEGTKILSDRDILLVPDVLASAGGVTVSYFEWVQNNQGFYWSEEEVEEKLEK